MPRLLRGPESPRPRLAAAVARHRYAVMGTLVYPEPHHRAAALLHTLARVPALEHSNELFAAMTASAYLQASGQQVKVTTDDAADLVAAAIEGRLTIRDAATAMTDWIS
ncbi:fic family toxin-antitoxin system, toxin component [Streptomyces sp. NPDC056707]|uniref:fic family toxin-antitoxin system, toxin component n=1 Tax=Streptomyces sp. NPDC056707 TaxID=3345919 RepID=UPI0036AD000A